MKNKISAVYFFLIISSLVLLSGCALELLEIGELAAEEAGGLAASEVAAGIAAEDVALIAAEEESILGEIVTEEGTLNTKLAEVRVREALGENPRLYVNTRYGTKDIAEITGTRTIRVLDKGISKSIPGEFFKVKGDVVKVRSTKFLDANDYNLKYKIYENELVLVLSERDGWYTVWLGENKVGYVKAGFGLLVPVLASTSFANNASHHPIYKTCSNCNGVGTIYKTINCTSCNGYGYLNCNSCKGNGKITCYSCNGNGKNTCYSCKGKGNNTCYSCNGRGYNTCYSCYGKGYNQCSACYGRGFTSCSTCYGTGRLRDQRGFVHQCNRCHGYGKFQCSRCRGHGNIQCSRCLGQKTFTCNRCGGHGSITCSTCGGVGTKTCNTCGGVGSQICHSCGGNGRRHCDRCNGNKTIQVQYLCNNCRGAGQIDIADY
ncbi:MAG TPA: hypothetical protein VE978_10635 [Chitinophagales bacterium]|nr:hypothetical protein [Chitinophagales bacterium]